MKQTKILMSLFGGFLIGLGWLVQAEGSSSERVIQLSGTQKTFDYESDLLVNPEELSLESAPVRGKVSGDLLTAEEFNRLLELTLDSSSGGVSGTGGGSGRWFSWSRSEGVLESSGIDSIVLESNRPKVTFSTPMDGDDYPVVCNATAGPGVEEQVFAYNKTVNGFRAQAAHAGGEDAINLLDCFVVDGTMGGGSSAGASGGGGQGSFCGFYTNQSSYSGSNTPCVVGGVSYDANTSCPPGFQKVDFGSRYAGHSNRYAHASSCVRVSGGGGSVLPTCAADEFLQSDGTDWNCVAQNSSISVTVPGNPRFTPLAQQSIMAYGEKGTRSPGDKPGNYVKAIKNGVLTSGTKYGFVLATSGERTGTREILTAGVDQNQNITSRCYNSASLDQAGNITFTNFDQSPVVRTIVSYQGTFVYNPDQLQTNYTSPHTPRWGMFTQTPGDDLEYQNLASWTQSCSDPGKGDYMLYIFEYDTLKTIMDTLYSQTGEAYYRFNDPLSSDTSLHNNFWTN